MNLAANNKELSALWYTDPAQAVRRCQVALREAAGNRERAAAALGIGERTLYKWMLKHPEIKNYSNGSSKNGRRRVA